MMQSKFVLLVIAQRDNIMCNCSPFYFLGYGTFFQQWEDFVRIWGSVGICPKNLGVKTRY